MKRFLFSLLGTVGGLVALLSFKTQSPVATTGALPQVSLPSGSTSSTPSTSTSTSAPPKSTSGTSSSSTPKSSTSSAPAATTRQITGTAVTTQYGVVQVKITVSGTKITDVGFAQLTAFDGRSQEINSYAAPYLLQETITAQSANINTVSGATYTSEGYMQSLQSALDAAGIK